MTPLASLPDDELVHRGRDGDRGAFAVLYHRHVRRVYGTVAAASADGPAARGTTVAVFSELMRHLHDVDPARITAALDHVAARRIHGHAGSAGVPELTVGAVDAMWRELDQRWPTGEPPRRDVSNVVPVTAGALVAVLVLGTLASTTRRSGVPDGSRTFEAVAARDEAAPDLLPNLPRPVESTVDEPGDVSAPTETPPPPPPEPTPEPTSEPEPTADPTDEPTTSEEPSEEPSEADDPPVVTILSPSDGETRRSDGEDEAGAYATVSLRGTASDDRDEPEMLQHRWTSDLEGELLSAPSGQARLHVPEGRLAASHTLTYAVTDSAGNTTTASVTVTVTRV